jgi:replicative superfamily II helicase
LVKEIIFYTMSVRGYEMRYNYLKGIFKFDSFNAVQEECMSTILKSNASMVVSAPTSSGKTVLF